MGVTSYFGNLKIQHLAAKEKFMPHYLYRPGHENSLSKNTLQTLFLA